MPLTFFSSLLKLIDLERLQEFLKPTPSLDFLLRLKRIVLQQLPTSTPYVFALGEIDPLRENICPPTCQSGSGRM
jgi:hypothetical protein